MSLKSILKSAAKSYVKSKARGKAHGAYGTAGRGRPLHSGQRKSTESQLARAAMRYIKKKA